MTFYRHISWITGLAFSSILLVIVAHTVLDFQNEVDTFDPLTTPQRIPHLVIGLIITGLAVGGLALLWSAIVRPLLQLTRLAQDYTLGQTNQRAPSFWVIELHQLGTAFNVMLEQLSAQAEKFQQAANTQTEQALRDSEARYRGVVDDSPGLICCFLPDGEITFVNKSYCDYFAKTPQALIGSNFLSLIPEADRATVLANITALTVEAPTQAHEHQVIAPGQDIRWQHWTNRALFNAQEQVIAYQAIGEDTTERKQAEAALRQSEERFRNLVEGSLQGILVHRNNKLLFANQAAANLLGYNSPDEILALGSGTPLIAPYERERVLSYHPARIKGEPAPNQYEYDAVGKDGTIVTLQQFVTMILWDDEPVVLMTILDITERKRAETEVRESREKLQSILDTAPDYILTIEKGGLISFINRTYPGVTVDEVIGTNVLNWLPQGYRAEFQQLLADVFETGQPNELETVGTGEGGAPAWYLSRVGPIIHTGQVVALTMVGQDITPLQQAGEELRRSEGRLRQAQRLARIGIWEWELASDKTTWSAEMFPMYGIKPEEFSGKGADYLNFTHPDDRQMQQGNLQKAFENQGQTGVTSQIEPDPHEFRLVRPDGSLCYVRGDAVAIVDEQGQPVRMLGILMDITVEKEREEALRFQKTLLEAQSEASPDGILIVSNERQWLSYNQRFLEIWRYSPQVIAGRSSHIALQEALPQLVEPEQFLATTEYLYTHPDESGHDELRLKDGRVIERHSAPVKDAASFHYGRVWYFRDITQRKQAEAELQKRAAHLSLINDIGQQLTVLELDTLLNRVASLIYELFDYHHVALFLVDDQVLKLKAVAGQYKAYFPQNHTQQLTEGINGWVARHGQKVIANDVTADWRYTSLIAEYSVTKAELCLPITLAGQTVGILDLQSPRLNAFGVNDIMAMETLANQIADAIQNVRLYEAIRHELIEHQQTAEALRINEARLAEAQRIAHLGSWERNFINGGGIWSAEAYRIYGLDPAHTSSVFDTFLSIVHPADRERVLQAVNLAWSVHQPLDIEYRVVHSDQTVYIVHTLGEMRLNQAGEGIGMVGTVQDITERKLAEAQIKRHNRELATLNSIITATNVLFAPEHLADLLQTIADRAVEALLVDRLMLITFDLETKEIIDFVSGGPGAPQIKIVSFNELWEGLSGWVLRQGKAALSPKGKPDPRESLVVQQRRAETNCGAVIVVPLHYQGKTLGTITAINRPDEADFSEQDVNLLLTIASHIAIALEKIRLYRQIQQELAERVQAELALQKSEEYLRSVVDNVVDGLITIDEQGFIETFNPAAETTFGYTAAEVRGQNIKLLMPEPYHSQHDDYLGNYLHSGQAKIMGIGREVEGRRKDGSTFPLDLAIAEFYQGERRMFIGVVRDITKRKQAEESLRHHEAQLQRRNRELTLLNQVIAASATTLEQEAILEIACRELALAFELPQAAAALLNEAKTASIIVAEYRAEGRPSALELVIPVKDNPASQYILNRKTPLVVENAQSDPRLAPVHHLMRQRGTVSLLIVPLIIAGEVIGTLGLDAIEARIFSSEEITLAWSVADQVAGALARARLSQERRLLSAAIEQSVDSIIITNIGGSIIYVNPAFEKVTGYHRAEAMGQSPHILKSGRQEPAVYQELWATIIAGQVWHKRLINKKKDGSHYTVDAIITPVRDANDQIINYVVLQRDITGQLQLEEQLRQSQKMESVGRLAGGVAHDFNNLLTIIIGNIEFLASSYLNTHDPRLADIEQVRKAADRAALLVRQLLAFSRQQPAQFETLNLNQVVTNVEKMLEWLLGEHIKLVVTLTAQPVQIRADLGQMEQVLMNLAVNARDAMIQGGRLTLTTASLTLEMIETEVYGLKSGPYVLLTVTDTGHGMDKETQSRIFDPFFTTKEQGKGTGLGLATVFGIVEQHGGRIYVESMPGQGTTFKIYLPRVEQPVKTVAPPLAPVSPAPGQETILLVEDEAGVRLVARKFLEKQGCTVLEADHAAKALQLSQQYQGPIDLLITDVLMPEMNGPELAEQLIQQYPGLKVLFISGFADDVLDEYDLSSLNATLLDKPFSSNVLVHKVRQVLNLPGT